MDNVTFWIALVNFLLALSRLITAVASRRVVSLMWFLITYFSFFFIPVSLRENFIHRQGFTNNTVEITTTDIQNTLVFVLLFNIAFLLAELAAWRLVGNDNKNKLWLLPKSSRMLDAMSLAFLCYLILGTTLYGITSYQQGYRDYVEFQGSNWGLVFLWAGAPLIALAALRQQYLRALLASIPFLYFAVHLKVRSFALLSVIPIAIVLFLQIFQKSGIYKIKRAKLLIYATAIGVLLLGSSAVILQLKAGNERVNLALPDSGMPAGTVIIMKASDHYETRTGWDALTLYGKNFVNPFIRLGDKLFSIKSAEIVDPPVVMARLYDGVPKRWDVYFHYPALWYLDAYVAFGHAGILLGAFWGLIIVAWEKLMTRNNLLLGLLLPFFTWHIYMLVRGAIAGASAPMAYAFYLMLIPALLLSGFRLFYKERSTSAPRKPTPSPADPDTPKAWIKGR